MLGTEIAAYIRIFVSGGQAEFGRQHGWSRSRINNNVHYKNNNPFIRQKIADLFRMPVEQVFNGKPLTQKQTLQLLKRIAPLT